MNKFRQNIVTLFLAAAMLFTGNFLYAVAPVSCEMECCQESVCCESKSDENSNFQSAVIVNDDACCEVHVEQAVDQDDALITITNTLDNLKYELLKTPLLSQPEYKQDYTPLFTHKFNTTNIYLSVSNLRI